MNKEELNHKLKELEKRFDMERKTLIKEFCDSRNTYKVGDVFTDHVGSIIIEKMTYSLGGTSFGFDRACMIYEGVELKKDGTPKKNNPKRSAWQSNDVKLTND